MARMTTNLTRTFGLVACPECNKIGPLYRDDDGNEYCGICRKRIDDGKDDGVK
jgi:uncharacterized Zn finger protein (UPF0148 family)